MSDFYMILNNLISKYCDETNKCVGASVVRINSKFIYSLDLLSINDNVHKLITEIDGNINEYKIDFHLSPSSICVLPALAVLISNFQLISIYPEQVIVSGDSLLCSYLNYSLKFNGTNSVLCVGTNKQKLLRLVSNTDINLFFNALTQSQDEVIIDNYDLNIIVDSECSNLINNEIAKHHLKIDNYEISSNLIDKLSEWLYERKINDETFYYDDVSLLNNNETLSAIFIKVS
jgi:hypothetical protein